MKVKLCCVLMLLAISLYACTPNEKKIIFPNGKISLSIQVEDHNETGYGKALFYIKDIEGQSEKSILSSATLSIETEQQKFDNLKLLSVSEALPIEERLIANRNQRFSFNTSYCVGRAQTPKRISGSRCNHCSKKRKYMVYRRT